MSHIPEPNRSLFEKARQAGFKMYITNGYAVSNTPFLEVQLIPFNNEQEYNAITLPDRNNRIYLAGTAGNRNIIRQQNPQQYVDEFVSQTIDRKIKEKAKPKE